MDLSMVSSPSLSVAHLTPKKADLRKLYDEGLHFFQGEAGLRLQVITSGALKPAKHFLGAYDGNKELVVPLKLFVGL